MNPTTGIARATSKHRRRSARITKVLSVMVISILVAAGAAGTAAGAPDPERHDSTPTGWGYYFTSKEKTISNYVKSNKMRLIDVEVVTKTPKFAVSMVHNSGPFARKWWWYYGKSLDQVKALLKDRRLIDLETYKKKSGARAYAAVMVDNTGGNSKAYRWYINVTPAFIADKVKSFKGRIIDIDKRGSGRYNVVLLKNTGEDAKSWWYYYRATVGQINGFLDENNARIVDIEPDGDGRYTVVMVRSQGEYWYWHNALTRSGVTDLQEQIGMRIYDIERYKNPSGKTRYAVLLLNNIDAAGTAARQAMWSVAEQAKFGFYLKQVDGPVLQWIRANKVFEPASMLKALHHITAMLAVKDGAASVGEFIQWFRMPDDPSTPGDESMNGGVCAYADDGTPITTLGQRDALSTVLTGMMQQSDNRMTDAIYNRFGHDAINSTADSLGMSKTELNHRIGCTWEAAEVEKQNELTLEDHGKIFEAVTRADNPILGPATSRNPARDQFFQYMSSGLGFFTDVVVEEANALGKDAVADSFLGSMRGAFKPGGYRNGVEGACDENTCSRGLLRSTGGGWVSLPFLNGGAPAPKSYVYGAFFDGIFDCAPGMGGNFCTEHNTPLGNARAAAYAEMLRPHIRAALQTW